MREIRAITLHQPWANLIADGRKRFETRSWGTKYRGLILIHAGKKTPDSYWCEEFFYETKSLPLGAIVCSAELVNCHLMTSKFIDQQSTEETVAGCWQSGRYAWELSNIRSINPIECPGMQGLWVPMPFVRNDLIGQGVL